MSNGTQSESIGYHSGRGKLALSNIPRGGRIGGYVPYTVETHYSDTSVDHAPVIVNKIDVQQRYVNGRRKQCVRAETITRFDRVKL